MENPGKHPIVVLKDVQGWEAQCIVDFMYRGETLVPEAQLSSLVCTAESLMVQGLASSLNRDVTTSLMSQQRCPSQPRYEILPPPFKCLLITLQDTYVRRWLQLLFIFEPIISDWPLWRSAFTWSRESPEKSCPIGEWPQKKASKFTSVELCSSHVHGFRTCTSSWSAFHQWSPSTGTPTSSQCWL